MRGLTTTQIVLAERDLQPRDGRSAGFKSPGTYFHSSCLLNSRISFILFQTNVPHYMSRLIHANTVVESDQNVVLELFRVRDLITEVVSLTAIVAAINSRRGIVAFSGVMRDLAQKCNVYRALIFNSRENSCCISRITARKMYVMLNHSCRVFAGYRFDSIRVTRLPSSRIYLLDYPRPLCPNLSFPSIIL